MNLSKLTQAWYPVLPAPKLRTKPVGITLLDKKLVLVRLSGQVVCFDDYCPHRQVPLSQGTSDGKVLQCLYHGWQFDVQGKLTHLPACMGQLPDVCLNRHACTEEDGWIWVNLHANDSRPNFVHFGCPDGFDCHDTTRALVGDFIHSIENFLDPTHTLFIHKGLLRGTTCQSMSISQTHDERSFCTTYRLHQKQNGLINRLFDGGIDINLARFELPALASIDYLKQDKLTYRIALFFVPVSQGNIQLSVRVCLPKGIVPSGIKFLALTPFLMALFKQDQDVLSLQFHHRQFPKTPYVISQSDLVIDHLLYLLADMPEGVDKSGQMVLQ